MVYKYVLRPLLELALPKHCPITDQKLNQDEKDAFISHEGRKLLGKIHQPCINCGLPMPAPSSVACGQCQKQPPSFNRVISACPYQAPINSMLKALKFHNKLEYANTFAALLSQQIQEHYKQEKGDMPELALAVPLHHKRLRKRGYNQSFEITKRLCKNLAIRYDNTYIQRIKYTQEQSGLSAKERRKNLRGAFQIKRAIPAKHIALIDDVMTTATTAETISKLLKNTGVKQVDIWVVARTLKQHVSH